MTRSSPRYRGAEAGARPRAAAAVRALLLVVAAAVSSVASGPAFAGDEPQELAGDAERARRDARVERFLEHLAALRGGDRSAAPLLLEVAGELCDEHDRCDTLDVARYYAALSDAELARGLVYETRYRDLYREVQAADGLEGEPWLRVRARVLDGLGELARESRADADFAPAGRALSLAARLRAESLERRPDRDTEGFRRELAVGRDEAARALELLRAAGQRGPQLEASWVAGRLARLAGRRELARASFEDCLAGADRLGYAVWGERALVLLLDLARDVGDTQAQERLLDRLSSWTRPEASWELVRSYADWVLNLDRPRLASEILARYPPAGEVAAWHLLCGGAALRAGELDAARTHYGWLQEHEDGQLAALSRASLYLADGKPREVVRELGGGALGLDFTAQAEALGHSLLGEAHLALGEPRDAARELSHALALAETWRSGIAGDEHNVFGEWIGLHTVTLRALAERELGRDLEAARIVEDYQSRSLRSAPADGSAPASTGHAGLAGGDLTAWADRFELGLVTWAVGADFGVAAHVAPGGRPSSGGAPEDIARAVRVERGRREIRTAGRRLREAVVDGRADAAGRLARELADVLFPPPLRARLGALAGGGPEPRVLLLVHGPLESLPLELVLAEALGEGVVPVVMPGLPSAVPPADAPDFARLPGWALVAGGAEERPALPAARAEVEALTRRLASSVVPAATLADLRPLLAEDRPLHLASHVTWGCACNDTRLAPLALELAGGEVLCSHEVARLAPRSPLVVLSACETAAGASVDAEGLLGLGRAFLESGTRNLLVTMWPVEDDAARRLALRFHEELASGARPSVAAHRARRTVGREGVAPSEWAAYRLLGVD